MLFVVFLFLPFITSGSTITSRLTLSPYFTDNAVLQVWDESDTRPYVYGEAPPSATITLTITSIASGYAYNKSYTAETSTKGTFFFQLDGTYCTDPNGNPGPHYGPYYISVTDGVTIVNVNNVLFGDVYVCAGDVQMAFPMKRANVSHKKSSTTFHILDMSNGANARWASAPEGLDDFSALCYLTAWEFTNIYTSMFAGNEIMPFGLVMGARAGTLLSDWDIKKGTAYLDLIQPLIHLSFRTVVFAQGVQDAMVNGSQGWGSSDEYGAMVRNTISSWRDKGVVGNYGWVYAQLPRILFGNATTLNAVRLGQASAIPLPFNLSNPEVAGGEPVTTGMAITVDMVPYWDTILLYSRRNVQETARRLALMIAHAPWGKLEPHIGYSPPVLKSVTGHTSNGIVTLWISFKDVPGSAMSNLQQGESQNCTDCCSLSGRRGMFEIYFIGNGSWVQCDDYSVLSGGIATVNFSSSVVVDHSNVTMRYAALSTECVIMNGNGIPLGPFHHTYNIGPNKQAETTSTIPVVTYTEARHLTEQRIPKKDLWAVEWNHSTLVRFRSSYRALTAGPIMGFSTWNSVHCWADEKFVREQVNLMVSLDMTKAGYLNFNVDDCWQSDRAWTNGAFNGTIIADPSRFPSGMRELGMFVNSAGMHYGSYTSQTQFTCQGRPGAYQHEAVDAQTYCDWNVDFLKIDDCAGSKYDQLNTSWILFRAALDACRAKAGRPPIFLACSSCGPSNPDGCQSWIRALCNQWRTVGDIQATWGSVMQVLETNDLMRHVGGTGDGRWNDADMLQVGNVGLTYSEQVSHFSLWCLIAAPLLISTDLRHISPETLTILLAPELIMVSQDLMGIQGTRVSPRAVEGQEVWAKPLLDGSVAVVLLNRALAPSNNITCDFSAWGWPQGTRAVVRDLWKRADVGTFTDSFTSSLAVPSHGVQALKITMT
jgi:alpha-galactosidase